MIMLVYIVRGQSYTVAFLGKVINFAGKVALTLPMKFRTLPTKRYIFTHETVDM